MAVATADGSPHRSGKRLTLRKLFASRSLSVVLYAVVLVLIIRSTLTGVAAMGYDWQWYRIPAFLFRFTEDGFQLGEIGYGLLASLGLSGLSFVIALLLGLLVALLRLSGLVVGGAVARVFLELVRNIPLLVLLYLFYYVLGPIFGLDRYSASILCLGVFHAALVSEIIRAGINSVARGQWEAANSIGMTRGQAYRYIILPQSMRIMLPPLTSELVNIVKSSAIVSVVGVAEMTTAGRNIISKTYLSFEIWFTIAAIYLLVTVCISAFASYLESRYSVST